MRLIKHRIFRKKVRKKLLIHTKRRVYKKFLGLPTLKIRIPDFSDTTKLCKLYNKPIKTDLVGVAVGKFVKKPYIKKQRFIRVEKTAACDVIKPVFWKRLLLKHRSKELKLVRKDIAKLCDILKPTEAEGGFQPFLPPEVWRRMSQSERQNHIAKRRELSKDKQTHKKDGSTAAVSSKPNKLATSNNSKVSNDKKQPKNGQYNKKLIKQSPYSL